MNQIKKHNKPGFGALFGLPFFLAGCFFMYKGFDPNANWTPSRPSPWFIVPFCSIFILIGWSLMTIVTGYVVDPLKKTVQTYWGFLTPMFYKTRRVSEFEYVLVEKRRHRSKNRTYYRYPVSLVKINGDKFELDQGYAYSPARELAERISRECQVDFMDTHKGDGERISYQNVDPDFKDKVRSSDLSEPSLPVGSKIKTKNTSAGLKILIPRSKSVPVLESFSLVGSIIFAAIGGSFFYSFIKDDKMGPFKFIAIGFFTIPILVALIKITLKYLSITMITVGKKNITLQTSYLFYNSKAVIPIKDIDDIEGADLKVNEIDPKINKNVINLFAGNSLRIIYQGNVLPISRLQSLEEASYLKDLIFYQISRNQ